MISAGNLQGRKPEEKPMDEKIFNLTLLREPQIKPIRQHFTPIKIGNNLEV